MRKFVVMILTVSLLMCVVSCKNGTGNDNGDDLTGPKIGDIVTGESYMDAEGNITIDGTIIPKTSEVIVIPSGTSAKIAMTDDSSWNTYCDDSTQAWYKGVFLKDRKVKLSPFVMSQYDVTEQLWDAVMCDKSTNSIKPKTEVDWYQAIIFCNILTSATGGTVDDFVYEVDGIDPEEFDFKYGGLKSNSYRDKDIWDKVVCHPERKGYRLPTEAEWEFAARGGNPKAGAWKYAYSGIPSVEYINDKEKMNAEHYDEYGRLCEDENLNKIAVYYCTENKKMDVGTKMPNTINLYDMCGNVYEWCWDWYNVDVTLNDITFKNVDTGYIENPLGPSTPPNSKKIRCVRSSSYNATAIYCSVSCRSYRTPYEVDIDNGFRVCRTIQ